MGYLVENTSSLLLSLYVTIGMAKCTQVKMLSEIKK